MNGVRAERKARGMSITKLVMQTGIGSQDISAIELGKKFAFPGWRKKLCGVFDMTEAELFPEDHDKNSH